MPAVDFMQEDFPAESIPMESQHLRRLGLVSLGLLESRLDECLFEFTDRFFQIDSSLQHFGDQQFQLLSHKTTLSLML